ncbi:M81 family metallopeptidase [Ammoniphilus resinae]|uniref:Microcystin degradation protein MlrC n=1 Tax=Ammoniphilus resinae TaxID=861532 RepID=A0ABS4GSS7_9BACL|nr:M81 family metallopeptidase [Ammoniphilus resinae]MBP1933328.1 microcystin degradation protein MlrC [Ammoniphilus resinae]
MRIYYASIIQETNTFSPLITNLTNFQRGYYLEGSEIRSHLFHTNSEIAGFLQYLELFDEVTLIPGIAAWAVPSGKIKKDALQFLINRLVDELQKNLPVDGVLLSLHGALVSDGLEDCEGYILEQVRRVVGTHVKIVSTLDYHAAVTEKMIEMSDILVGFRTYPHVDFKDTGVRAAKCMKQLLDDNPKISKYYATLPLILPVENTETSHGPMSHAIQHIEQLDHNRLILSASLFCPQPWLDINQPGVSMITYTLGDSSEEWMKTEIVNILSYIWDSKLLFFNTYPTVERVLDKVDQWESPIILIDSGDVISGGAIGDSTVILREMIKHKKNLSAVIPIVDSKTVEQAFQVGKGKSAWFEVGGEKDYGYNCAVKLQAYISELSEQIIEVKGSSFSGIKLNLGRRALLKIDPSIQLIVSEYPTLIHDAEVLRSIGIIPEEQDLIIQKSHKLFRASYQNIAKSIVIVDTPGFTDLNLKRLRFNHIKKPMYPFDQITLREIKIQQYI